MNIHMSHVGIETHPIDVLPYLSVEERAGLASNEKQTQIRTPDHHRSLMMSIPAMRMVELGGFSIETGLLSSGVTVAAWNLERCLFPEASAQLLQSQNLDIVLLTEMDNGMARTSQRHTSQIIAEILGMQYAYGIEFLELGLGGETETRNLIDNFNACGWHGNAILARQPFQRVALLRLDDHGHWYNTAENSKQAAETRIGGRMAIAAVMSSKKGEICFVSVHLESNADAVYRGAQMEKLLNLVEDFAGGLPVIIGGDLNTGNTLPNSDWKLETLFASTEARGYSWTNNAEGPTVRESLITLHQPVPMKLDWFCHRLVEQHESYIVEALDDKGIPLSDHEMIVGKFRI